MSCFVNTHWIIHTNTGSWDAKHTHTHTHASIHVTHCIHSCLGQAKSKMVVPGRHGEHDILSLCFRPDSPWFLSPQRHPACFHNLLDSTARHRPGPLGVSQGWSTLCGSYLTPCLAAHLHHCHTLAYQLLEAPSRAWFIVWKMVNTGETFQSLG